MDGFHEKKWFVYLGDHHEGPFSLSDLRDKNAAGLINASSFAWSEGMADWRMVSDIPEMESALWPNNGSGDGAPSISSFPLPSEDGPSVSLVSIPSLDTGPSTSGPAGDLNSLGSSDSPSVSLASSDESVSSASLATSASASASVTPVITTHSSIAASQAAEAAAGAGSARTGVSPEARLESMRVDPDKRAPRGESSRNPSGLKWLLLVLVIALVAVATQLGYLDPMLARPEVKAARDQMSAMAEPVLFKAVEKFPPLGKWFSPLPPIADVSEADLGALKAAAIAPLDGGAPRAALAPTTADPLNPEFYVGSNLPDGAQFDLYIEGVGDTLLNHLSYAGKFTTSLHKRLGKFTGIRYSDGQPLPRGDYLLWLVESTEQPAPVAKALEKHALSAESLPAAIAPGRKVVVKSMRFLGGKKDDTYVARLKEFHDKLRDKATAELNEIRQFNTLLGSQAQATISEFERLKSKRNAKPTLKAWNDTHAKWTKLSEQLSASFAKWTPEALQADYFYGSLYALARTAGESLIKLHAMHHAYFTGAPEAKDATAYEAQIQSETQVTQAALTALDAKVQQAASLPASPGGVPGKEGL